MQSVKDDFHSDGCIHNITGITQFGFNDKSPLARQLKLVNLVFLHLILASISHND